MHFAFSLSAQDVPPPDVPPAAPSAAVDEEFETAVYTGKKFAEMGDYASAYEHLSKANSLKADEPAVLYNIGVVLARAGRYSDAQGAVDRYLQLFPNGVEKPNIVLLQRELQFQRAVQKKRQQDQEYADLFNRAKFHYGRGELADALRLFTQAEQLRGHDAAAVYNQALVYEKQGDYAKAVDRFRRYLELEGDPEAKIGVDERIFNLQRELEDMKSKIVCSFCGRKLPIGATWCERCWHGPYHVQSPVWNTRSCADGASATRATYFADQRFNRNDILPCLWKDGSMLETLRYSPARQRTIRSAREAEGWTYAGEVLQDWSDKSGNQIRMVQGPQHLEKITSSTGGEVLTYVAHAGDSGGGGGIWLLDREDLVIDAQRYLNRYTYDAAGRIAQQQVEYQNTAACNHLISMTADYAYANDALSTVAIKGGYQGYPAEGNPKTDWTATVAYSYDEKARVTKEEVSLASFNKTYDVKPAGALRDDINKLYPSMRIRKPIENLPRTGDLCAGAGTAPLTNAVDLRPFYTLSPNLGIALQNGITRAVVTFTYPE
ncbi:MAG TPA: tetratricopeptide repeat protein [Thermoanaerobaculia bacterium]|nr:tetratricopeptide repeat protein [Thermoanaerobaculia bacterium]